MRCEMLLNQIWGKCIVTVGKEELFMCPRLHCSAQGTDKHPETTGRRASRVCSVKGNFSVCISRFVMHVLNPSERQVHTPGSFYRHFYSIYSSDEWFPLKLDLKFSQQYLRTISSSVALHSLCCLIYAFLMFLWTVAWVSFVTRFISIR
jgi:hypothetical protein